MMFFLSHREPQIAMRGFKLRIAIAFSPWSSAYPLWLSVALLLFLNVNAQQLPLKFDFGTAKAAPGYIPITPDTKFSYQKGYGFDQGSVVESIDRGGNQI